MKYAISSFAIGFAIFGVGVLARREDAVAYHDLWLIARSAGALAIFVGVISLLTTLDRRTEAALRLDWFLPELRRVRIGQDGRQRWLGRTLRAWLPETWRSRYPTKQRGKIRRGLRKIGNSWLSSPLRRVTQSICLLLFLGSFFYVCWPYRARPAEPVQVSSGWQCIGIDQSNGRFRFQNDDADEWISSAEQVHIRLSTSSQPAILHVASAGASTLELIPPTDLPSAYFNALLLEHRSWSLYDRAPDAWPTHYADDLSKREWLPADLFLVIDPLVSLSTAIASRSWVWSLTSAAIILMVCLVVPRGFCGYICPLGTTIDLFDWAIGSRIARFRVSDEGWWVHIKYYLLAATLIAASMGVLLSGFVAAIPVITRALLFMGEPIQSGSMRGWHLVPAPNIGHLISIVMFFAVLCLGFLKPRFWCKYVCPSGAVFSLGNLLRITERKIESSCIHCNKCVEICPFDAIKLDFTTRGTDCTMCQTCGGVCPTHAIKFVERWNVVELKIENDPPTDETNIGRRGFLSLAGGSVAAVAGGVAGAATVKAFGANLHDPGSFLPVRPPGSVPEDHFLQMCIRCGECFKVCPNNVLQPEGLEQGLEGLWTPRVEANWAGCESSCNACGQVCPTGAIRALPINEKRVARMGLAIVNEQTCLPYAGSEDCDLCVQECIAAGYHAIEYIQVGTETDELGLPIESSGRLAPVVLQEKCVGCGLCQTRCYAINVKDRGLLNKSAILVEAGQGREDRLLYGSYLELRSQEINSEQEGSTMAEPPTRSNVPRRNSNPAQEAATDTKSAETDNPFGL